jgi:hypothetical protein
MTRRFVSGRPYAAVRRFIEERIPGAVLMEAVSTRLRYRLPATTSSSSSSLANVFALLEAAGQDLGIEDYQLGQTTLEAGAYTSPLLSST